MQETDRGEHMSPTGLSCINGAQRPLPRPGTVVSRIMRTGTSLSRPVAVLLREIAAELITQKSTHFASTAGCRIRSCVRPTSPASLVNLAT